MCSVYAGFTAVCSFCGGRCVCWIEETDVAVSESDGIENSTKESYDTETDLSETQFSESETEFEELYQTDDTEYETESEVETETELDSYYADDPQYGKEMQKHQDTLSENVFLKMVFLMIMLTITSLIRKG